MRPSPQSQILTLHPDAAYYTSPADIAKSNAFGRLLGLCLYNEVPLPFRFPRSFYKFILDKPVTLADIQSTDPQFYRQLRDVEAGVGLAGRTFAVNQRELLPGRGLEAVTQDNKDEYIRAMVKYIAHDRVRKHLEAIRNGLFEVIPQDLLLPFTPAELERVFNVTYGNARVNAADLTRKINALRRTPQCQRSRRYFTIQVDRQNLIMSAYQVASSADSESLRGNMSTTFVNEPGSDSGGLTKDFLSSLGAKLVDPATKLFVVPPGQTQATINPNSATEAFTDQNGITDLHMFRFFGRVMAWSFFQGVPMGMELNPAFFKILFDFPLSIDDAKFAEPGFYNSMVFALNAGEDQLADYGWTFVADESRGINLIENGDQIQVTTENQEEFVSLKIKYELETKYKAQFDAIREGLFTLIPRQLFRPFTAAELVAVFCGSSELNVADWKRNTDYVGLYSDSPVVGMFWRAVDSFDEKERAAVLMFTTGVSRVPPGGFAALKPKFTIQKGTNAGRMFTAQTCFNVIRLTDCATYEAFREKLLLSVLGSEGFGFA